MDFNLTGIFAKHTEDLGLDKISTNWSSMEDGILGWDLFEVRKMSARSERIERIAYKIRKTVPINTGTKVERDKTKYDKGQRKQWKHELKRYESREELVLDLLRKGHTMQEAVLIAASVEGTPVLNRTARIAERVMRSV